MREIMTESEDRIERLEREVRRMRSVALGREVASGR